MATTCTQTKMRSNLEDSRNRIVWFGVVPAVQRKKEGVMVKTETEFLLSRRSLCAERSGFFL